ncbi:hypothetical protein, partial [Xanthomonas oryzae]|uniref:hypothetical protein n=1 Tax=Xanthomonas oryzae TaxID=347 RepID=UPI003CE928DD
LVAGGAGAPLNVLKHHVASKHGIWCLRGFFRGDYLFRKRHTPIQISKTEVQPRTTNMHQLIVTRFRPISLVADDLQLLTAHVDGVRYMI